MTRLLYFALAILACIALPSCSLVGKGVRKGAKLLSWKKKKKPDAPQSENAVHIIGIIEMVNPEQRFVLIRTQGKLTIPAGQEITAIDSSGAQTKLKVSPEKKQDFLIADIVDGNPHNGNVVMFKPDKRALPPANPSQPVGPGPPPLSPPTEPPVQPPPLTPVAPSEFTRPDGAVPPTPSPIPPQPMPSATPGATVPAPGQIQLPPVIR